MRQNVVFVLLRSTAQEQSLRQRIEDLPEEDRPTVVFASLPESNLEVELNEPLRPLSEMELKLIRTIALGMERHYTVTVICPDPLDHKLFGHSRASELAKELKFLRPGASLYVVSTSQGQFHPMIDGDIIAADGPAQVEALYGLISETKGDLRPQNVRDRFAFLRSKAA